MMSRRLVGYARVSDALDLTAQREALARLGVAGKRVYVDHALVGTNHPRPGLRQAIAACRAGDTLVITKLDRLARSLPDARDIAEELAANRIKLSLGGTVHDPSDPVGRELFTVLALVAEFESDLARARTREGMAVAKAKGRLRGKQPKLNVEQEKHLVGLWRAGAHTSGELAELFTVARSTVYRAIQRAGPSAPGTAPTSSSVPEPDSRRLGAPGRPQDTSRAPNTRSNPTPIGALTAAERSDLEGRTGARAGANAAVPAGATSVSSTAVTGSTDDLAALAVGPTREAAQPRKGAAAEPVHVARKLGRWFLVEADVRDDQGPVVVLSRHTTERAAVAALGKARRQHPTHSDEAVLQVRQAEQIVSRLEWDAQKRKGVVLAGLPDAR